MKTIESQLTLSNQNIAIVVSSWNEAITSQLMNGAIACYKQLTGHTEQITIIHVSGCFEIPLVCQRVARTNKYHGIVTLGVVIQGDTDHHLYVAGQCASGISKISLEQDIPIAFGILTTKNLEQAQLRAGSKYGNKGFEAMHSLIETLSLLEKIQ